MTYIIDSFLLFSGKDFAIGITDFLKIMSKPAWVWGNKYDLPLLNTMESEEEDFIHNMFNFDNSAESRDDNNDVSAPDFQKMELSTYCKNVNNDTVKKYCDMADNLPDIADIMPLMYLASFPMDISSSSLKAKIK